MDIVRYVVFVIVLVAVFGGIISCTSQGQEYISARDAAPLPDGNTEWTEDMDITQKSLVNPPEKIPLFTKIILKEAEKVFEKELLPGRILTWSDDASLASGFLEKYIEKGAGKVLDPRLIYLIRLQVSYFVSCPFAIDVNSWQYKEHNITPQELNGLQGVISIDEVESFSKRELVALKYTIAMSKTPVTFNQELLTSVRDNFSQEDIVAISTLAAKVNYWARLIESWRIKPIGYSDDPLLRVEDFGTFSLE